MSKEELVGKEELEDKEELETKDSVEDKLEDKEITAGTGTKDSEDKDLENQRVPYSRFKDIVDEKNKLKERLDKLEKEQEDKRNEELKEQGKYEELYKDALQAIEDMKQERAASKIKSLLSAAGYQDNQIERLSKLVEGETEEEIKDSIEDLKATFPTKTYVDPSVDNRKRSRPEGVDGEDIGQSIFDRLKNAGKLKGYK